MSSPTNEASRALRQVRLSRLLSWIAGLVGLAFVGTFLYQAGLFHSLLPADAPVPPAVHPEQISAADSTVNGIDQENQPYRVSALRGWQDEKTPTLVHLETVSGTFRKANGVEYEMTAATGLYDTTVKGLDLNGNVTVVQKDRFTAVMDRAHVMAKEKSLTSDVPVDVTFGSGTIHANGMKITDDGARILFLNGVKAHFQAAPAKGDGQQ